ncbi:MAG: hypothetical protein ACJ72D_30285, partial [Marmoricola sp.]
MSPDGSLGTQSTRSLAEQRAHEEWREVSGRRGMLIDWALLGFAGISVGLPLWFIFGPQPPYAGSTADWHDTLLVTDLVVSVVFAGAICVRWLRSRVGRLYLRRHWWEIPALI